MKSKKKLKYSKKNTDLIWVYPPNKWTSNYKQTFIYGWSNPKAKLFIEIKNKKQKIKVHSNGNFAQVIKLSDKKNTVKLIQIVNGKRKIVTRYILMKSPVRACRRMPPQIIKTKPRDFTKNNMVIIIDPGHGGKEHGTHSPKGIPESYFNLQIAKKIVVGANGCLPSKRQIYLTRSKDKFVSLKNRVEFAKNKKCDLFISIHHNALPDNEDPNKHSGIGIYYTHNYIKPIAEKFLHCIVKETKLKKYGVFKRDFAVTRPDFYRGILIECGFLIHPIEASVITSKQVQEKIAIGIIKALIS